MTETKHPRRVKLAGKHVGADKERRSGCRRTARVQGGSWCRMGSKGTASSLDRLQLFLVVARFVAYFNTVAARERARGVQLQRPRGHSYAAVSSVLISCVMACLHASFLEQYCVRCASGFCHKPDKDRFPRTRTSRTNVDFIHSLSSMLKALNVRPTTASRPSRPKDISEPHDIS